MAEDSTRPIPLRPYHVALCTLIQFNFNSEQAENGEIEMDFSNGSLTTSLLKYVRNTSKCPPLSYFLRQLKVDMPGGEIGEWAAGVVVDQLRGLHSPDDLIVLFMALLNLIIDEPEPAGEDPLGFDPQSALGQYLRRCNIGFAELSFEGVCRLHADVQSYLQEATRSSQKPIPVSPPSDSPDGSLPASAGTPCSTGGINYKAATEALRDRDVSAAISSLHQYFDHAGVHAGKGSIGRHQSALLSLGAFHTQLGHVQEATLALNEALHVAQQSSDHVALAHSLAALTALLDAAAPGLAPSVQEVRGLDGAHTKHLQLLRLLRRCEKRGIDLHLPHIIAYACLALAKFALLHYPQASRTDEISIRGASTEEISSPMIEVGAAAREVTHLHSSASQAAAVPIPPLPPAGPPPGGPATANVPRPAIADLYNSGPVVFDAAAKESQAASAAAVEELAGSAQLLKAVTYERCGAPGLARTAALTRLAAEPAPGGADTEERCLAYAQLAMHAADHKGFRAAAQVLEVADEENPDAQSRPLAMARLGIAHQQALAHGDIISAQQLGAAMSALAEPDDAVHLNLRIEAETRNVQTLMKAGSLEEAASRACKLFDACQEAGLLAEAVRSLILLADIHMRAQQPTAALPYALSAMQHATELRLDVMAAEASAQVAAASGRLGPGASEEACATLVQALPTVLGCAPRAVQADVQLALARAMLATATEEQLREEPNKVLTSLGAAAAAYEGVENWAAASEAHHLSALVCHSAHLLPQRSAAASAWQRTAARAEAAAAAQTAEGTW